MTDNEKRAHDIALLWIKEVLEKNVNPITEEDCIKNRIVEEYLTVYSKTLSHLNNN